MKLCEPIVNILTFFALYPICYVKQLAIKTKFFINVNIIVLVSEFAVVAISYLSGEGRSWKLNNYVFSSNNAL